jgi:hypothetical protein
MVHLQQEIFTNFGHRLDLQLLQHVLDISGDARIPEALLLQEGDLVVEHLQLLEEQLLTDRRLEDGRPRTG